MSNSVAASSVKVKRFRLPDLDGEFFMAGDYVYKADTKEQAFVYSEGRWIVVRKQVLDRQDWISVLEKTRAS